ncbi:site-specific tyrosine recombinase XerD [Bacillus cereus]|uniref:tyrosine-type recombinase/integrase n=1 Tax=Bacillus cereus TaxID=1396 RepID=UPI001EED6FDE|nr:tyrosine-type recombinase/integrase [Bacillus cereus]BCB40547.1 site-specific tyrosine recombinase XerD [Bacillus cereus]BCC03383.1 site-specific tyrosine recombinase XerD [Bacillus cereus]BCC26902.1 site-specific tyrosine recombinase XerD [Bacillus cereus]BCC38462.1 site-specific tyrosine recombinase XerD [Bacillus cereus]BCC44260.1 site-specific tyrosine recombinase XerD [Bacillus cereus]
MNTVPATISQSLESFKTHLLENDKSLNTIKSYSQDLNHFFNWIHQRYEPPHLISMLTSTDLKDYERQLKSDESIAPTTVNRRLVSLMKWSEFLLTSGSTNVNLSNNIKIKRIQKQNNIRWLTRKEVGKLLHAIELTKQQNYQKGMLHQTIIYLAVNSGLRVQEICNTRIMDVDIQRLILRVNGKGDKHRVVPLTENTKEAIVNWLKVREQESEYLLVSSKSNHITTRAVQHIFKRYSNQIGIEITPHSLRHTYCKQLAQHGVDIQSIAELAGHSSIETTRVYVTPSIQELHDALKKTEF